MRYWIVFPFLVLASVPPLFVAAFAIIARFNIPIPFDGFVFFCVAGFMAGVGPPISLFLVLVAALLAVAIYVSGSGDQSKGAGRSL